MSHEPSASFEEFWRDYLLRHRRPWTRRLHALGTAGAVAVGAYALVRRRPRVLWLAPVLQHGLAWVGHRFVEHNSAWEQADLRHPLWSLRADLRLLRTTLTGALEAEMARATAGGAASAAPDDEPDLAEQSEPTHDPHGVN
ncbi:MAG: DUF962 domain-containing protein [Polyangiaceae bacterium]|nr:DUF962 domain-containing protein [Polyangiaceae bacterium]